MRPIDKGSCPQLNGVDKTVSEYGAWRRDLIERIGAYCVYCNMPITHSLQIEHVIPKMPQSGTAQGSLLDWDNVLLACGPCNNAKSNTSADANLYYLPEYHNTLLPFMAQIHPSNPLAQVVTVNPTLTPSQQAKAQETIRLFKLDSVDDRDKIVDLRWMLRAKEAGKIKCARELLEMAKGNASYDEDKTAKHVAMMATGFFMLWFNEFANEPHVIKWLIHPSCFVGVAQNCFNSANGYQPIPRNPLNTSDQI